MRLYDRSVCLLVSVTLMLSVASCSGSKWRGAEGVVWGTTYHITYKADADLHDSIISVMRAVEQSLSPFSGQSLISRINRGEDVEADTLIAAVFRGAAQVYGLSSGAFDPTVAPAVNLWGFGYKNGVECPTDEQTDSVRALVGFGSCFIDNGRIVTGRAGMEFDFSAITKGFGCDMVGKMLERNGCSDYMVEIGGEIALSGANRNGEPWHIMIDAPLECDTAVVHDRLAVVEVTGCGIATSGNYRNYRNTAGGKVWHTIDPRTCRPAETATLSATVIAPDAMTADAIATACMVMDADSALAMAETRDGVMIMLVVGRDDGGWSVVSSKDFPQMR